MDLTPREVEQVNEALDAEPKVIPELAEAARKLDYRQFPGRGHSA